MAKKKDRFWLIALLLLVVYFIYSKMKNTAVAAYHYTSPLSSNQQTVASAISGISALTGIFGKLFDSFGSDSHTDPGYYGSDPLGAAPDDLDYDPNSEVWS